MKVIKVRNIAKKKIEISEDILSEFINSADIVLDGITPSNGLIDRTLKACNSYSKANKWFPANIKALVFISVCLLLIISSSSFILKNNTLNLLNSRKNSNISGSKAGSLSPVENDANNMNQPGMNGSENSKSDGKYIAESADNEKTTASEQKDMAYSRQEQTVLDENTTAADSCDMDQANDTDDAASANVSDNNSTNKGNTNNSLVSTVTPTPTPTTPAPTPTPTTPSPTPTPTPTPTTTPTPAKTPTP